MPPSTDLPEVSFSNITFSSEKNQLNTEALKRREGMKISREIIDDFSVGWTGAAMRDLSVL